MNQRGTHHKNIIVNTMILLWLMGIYHISCAAAQASENESKLIKDSTTQSLGEDRKNSFFRVLDIGNSYTDNSTCYMRELIEDLGLDTSNVCLYRTIFSGGSFKNWQEVYYDADTTTYYVQKVFGNISCNGINDSESCTGSEALKKLLCDNQWELIVIHQASRYAPYYSTWLSNSDSGYLEELLEIIRKNQPEAEIGTHLIHSYSSKSPYNKEKLSSQKRWRLIASSIRRMVEQHDISLVIPYGTVIERLRTTSLNNKQGLLSDGTHLSPGLARYAATCCYYESVFAPYFEKSMAGNTLRPEGYPSVDDISAIMVWEAVTKACENPYTLSDEIIPETGIRARIRIDDEIVTIKDVTPGEEILVYSMTGQLLRRVSPPVAVKSVLIQSNEISEDCGGAKIGIVFPKGVSILKINHDCLKIFIP